MDSPKGASTKIGKPWNVNHLNMIELEVNDLHEDEGVISEEDNKEKEAEIEEEEPEKDDND